MTCHPASYLVIHCKCMSLSHFSEEVIPYHTSVSEFFILFSFSQKFKSRMMISKCDGSQCFSSASCNVTVKFTMFYRHQLHCQVQGDFNYMRDGNNFAFPTLLLWISLCYLFTLCQFYIPFYSLSKPHSLQVSISYYKILDKLMLDIFSEIPHWDLSLSEFLKVKPLAFVAQ